MKKTIMFGVIIVVVVSGLVIGILFHEYNDMTIKKAEINQLKSFNEIIDNQISDSAKNILSTSSQEEKSTPSTVLIFETYYLKCGHLISEKKEIKESEVNKNQDYFSKNYRDWKIKKFSKSEIEFYKEVNDICDKHYVIKENDGYVSVYTLDGNGNELLKENTDIATQYLPNSDLDLLKNGIKANGDNELEEKLSDFE